MTLGQLYDAIDWGPADDAILGWVNLHEHPLFGGDTSEFSRHFRCAIIESALYDEDATRKVVARRRLHALGVWDQIIDILRQARLLSQETT